MGYMNRAKILEFIREHLHTGGNCLQGCGTAVPTGKLFCSDECLSLYDLKTWGEGKPKEQDLTSQLKASVEADPKVLLRYRKLVDKKYLSGLSAREANEMRLLSAQIDVSTALYYETMIANIKRRKA